MKKALSSENVARNPSQEFHKLAYAQRLTLDSSILPVRCFYCNQFLSRYQIDYQTIAEGIPSKFCCKAIVLTTKLSIEKKRKEREMVFSKNEVY